MSSYHRITEFPELKGTYKIIESNTTQHGPKNHVSKSLFQMHCELRCAWCTKSWYIIAMTQSWVHSSSVQHLNQLLTKAIAESNVFLLLYLEDGHNSHGEIPSYKITLGGFGLSHILLQGIGWKLSALVVREAGDSWRINHLFSQRGRIPAGTPHGMLQPACR